MQGPLCGQTATRRACPLTVRLVADGADGRVLDDLLVGGRVLVQVNGHQKVLRSPRRHVEGSERRTVCCFTGAHGSRRVYAILPWYGNGTRCLRRYQRCWTSWQTAVHHAVQIHPPGWPVTAVGRQVMRVAGGLGGNQEGGNSVARQQRGALRMYFVVRATVHGACSAVHTTTALPRRQLRCIGKF